MQGQERQHGADHIRRLDAVGRLRFVSTSDLQADFPVGKGKTQVYGQRRSG